MGGSGMGAMGDMVGQGKSMSSVVSAKRNVCMGDLRNLGGAFRVLAGAAGCSGAGWLAGCWLSTGWQQLEGVWGLVFCLAVSPLALAWEVLAKPALRQPRTIP